MQTLRGRYLRTLNQKLVWQVWKLFKHRALSMANISCRLWDTRLGTVFWVVWRECNGSVDGFDIAVAVNLLQ